MLYYHVDLGGCKTEAKIALTTRVQHVHEYYFGCNMDGSGPDEHADHHIIIRAKDQDVIEELRSMLYMDYSCAPEFFKIDDPKATDQYQRVAPLDRFNRNYASEDATPIPYKPPVYAEEV